MALFWKPSRENIRQQIQQINFVLANPRHPVAKIYLEFWPPEVLDAKLNSLVKQYRQPIQDRVTA